MTNLTPEQIKAAVLKGLKEVADQFARDPRPTDGTIRGGALLRNRSPRGPARKAASGKRKRNR